MHYLNISCHVLRAKEVEKNWLKHLQLQLPGEPHNDNRCYDCNLLKPGNKTSDNILRLPKESVFC